MPRLPKRNHNGGPPLDDYKGPAWGKGDPHRFMHWRSAHKAAWKPKSRDIAFNFLGRDSDTSTTCSPWRVVRRVS